MERRIAFGFIFQLVICHCLLNKPNIRKRIMFSKSRHGLFKIIAERIHIFQVPQGVEIEKISNVEIQSIPSESNTWRIIGGGPTKIEQYPYVVSLQKNGTFFGHDFEHFCVGNIIGKKWILTAAKCCYGKLPGQFHVRVGSDSYYEGGRIYEIESIAIHPKYDDVNWDYDVGLMKLSESITFNIKTQPIKLTKASRKVQAGTVVNIAGWGATELLGMPSDTINHNTITTINQSDCKAFYGSDLTDRMFCVFTANNGPCIGDTGSPAIVDDFLIGVASWSQSCAYTYPTAYARLPEMVDWVSKVTGESSSGHTKASWSSLWAINLSILFTIIYGNP